MGGEGCTHVIHGRSRMVVGPRIPKMPERSTSGFHRSWWGGQGEGLGSICLANEGERRTCSTEEVYASISMSSASLESHLE